MNVTIEHEDGRSEELDVYDVEGGKQELPASSGTIPPNQDPVRQGEEYWCLLGIQPGQSDLIPSRFTWLSGSMADPRSQDMDRFPLVYIPKEREITVKYE